MAIGISVELSIWAFLHFVVGVDAVLFRRFIWIERLQEAGMKAGEALASSVQSHLGWSVAPYLGTLGAFIVLMTLWSVVVFVPFAGWRSWRSTHAKERSCL